MEKSKVYFTTMKTSFSENLPQKLERLIKTAGIGNIDFSNKYAAIKMHFGEPGNLAYLRPNYAAVVVKVIKELGGKAFLTDCNTLYVGGRKNALDHIDAAYQNGFSPFSTGCHVIIADGLKGTDEELVPVEGGEYVKEAKIGRAIMDADVFITLSHFKGHEATGFGGALKNIGMGCGSRAGKMEMHNAGKPYVEQENCIGCGRCIKICAHDAPSITDLDSVPFHMEVSVSFDSVEDYTYKSPFMKCSSVEITNKLIPDVPYTEVWASMILHEYFHGFQFKHPKFSDYFSTTSAYISSDTLRNIYSHNKWFKEGINKENELLLSALTSNDSIEISSLISLFFQLREQRRNNTKKLIKFDIKPIENIYETMEASSLFRME